MGVFDKYIKKRQKHLVKLVKERAKQEKRIDKEFKKRMESKYTTKALKESKKQFTENAMTIDSLEYEKIVLELKKKFPTMEE